MAAWFRIRLGFVFMLFVAFFGLIGFRLVQLQVFQDPQLESLGKRQFRRVSQKTSFRLPIYDRNQEELAVSVPAGSVYARPRLIKQRRKTAKVLAKYLGGSPQKWLLKLQAKKPFVWIQRQLSPEKAKELAQAKLTGIFVESETKRFYPNGALASQILGFTDVDGNGLAGMELKYNRELFADERQVALLRDGKGTPTYIEKREPAGENTFLGVSLTIDRRIQYVVEEELEHALASTGAKNVMAIVMDPASGEIIAMGQRPSFDPNRSGQSSGANFTNTAISSLYEPGSTMKVLVAAEAIEAGLLKKSSMIDCGNGVMHFGNKTIHEAESDHAFKSLSLEKVIQYSSNIGAARVGEILGTKRVQNMLEKYRLTTKTGIELPAEASGQEKEDKIWKPIFLATASFGQGISVTPLQMVSAFAPFANGGYEVRPTLIATPKTELEKHTRILSPKTVQIMKEILVGVTESKDGTGAKARIAGLKVAGKTGTAQKYIPGLGYEGKKYFSSFIGFLPADEPQLLIGVMVDEPKFPFYASQVAAPLFKNIADRSLQLLDRAPKQVVESAPEMPKPVAASLVKRTRTVVPSEPGSMPDLAELSVREALNLLSSFPNEVKVVGDGYLESQQPAPGSLINENTQFVLTFRSEGG